MPFYLIASQSDIYNDNQLMYPPEMINYFVENTTFRILLHKWKNRILSTGL